MRTTRTKTDIINRLADVRGYCRYLEICTTITGNCYHEIDRARFPTCHRLMFRYTDGFEDGMPIDYRVAGLDIGDCARRVKAEQGSYDAILVDPWHEYATSRQALEVALDLIDARGTIVVHDCLPPTPRHAAPRFVDGEWCGVTYKAYLDVVLPRRDLAFLTVDTDLGCGVIRKLGTHRAGAPGSTLAARLVSALMRHHDDRAAQDRAALFEQWSALGDDGDATFRFFQAHKDALLNLVSARRFWRLERRMGRDGR